MSYYISSNGFKPVANYNNTQPKAHISVLKLNFPLNYSGLIYLMVPAFAAYVTLVFSILCDIPKSINLIFS